MTLRAFLVDDEPLALDRLGRLLRETGRVEVVGSAMHPEAAIEAMTLDPPDVCFLDIHMPRLTGFEVLLRLERQPAVVFTTAHDQYALQAFSANAVDYLLKPVERGALNRALAKAERLTSGQAGVQPQLQAMIRELAESWRAAVPQYQERMATRVGERITFLDLAHVSHFYAEDKLTFAVANGKAHCVDHALADLEKILDPRKFIRIHRGTILNIAWVREVSSLPGGSLHVRLAGEKGAEVVVARDRARHFKECLGC